MKLGRQLVANTHPAVYGQLHAAMIRPRLMVTTPWSTILPSTLIGRILLLLLKKESPHLLVNLAWEQANSHMNLALVHARKKMSYYPPWCNGSHPKRLDMVKVIGKSTRQPWLT